MVRFKLSYVIVHQQSGQYLSEISRHSRRNAMRCSSWHLSPLFGRTNAHTASGEFAPKLAPTGSTNHNIVLVCVILCLGKGCLSPRYLLRPRLYIINPYNDRHRRKPSISSSALHFYHPSHSYNSHLHLKLYL